MLRSRCHDKGHVDDQVVRITLGLKGLVSYGQVLQDNCARAHEVQLSGQYAAQVVPHNGGHPVAA